jgi:hypothetical protein
VVAAEQRVPAKADLAHLSGGPIVPRFRIDNLQVHPLYRSAERPHPRLVRIVDAGERQVGRGLGRTVRRHLTRPGHRLLELREALRRGDVHDQPQRAQIEMLALRVVQDAKPDRLEGRVGDGDPLGRERV